ncbi:MAG TPA: SDR family oxidoreductase [Vicinamibacterales bacterium]|jgi:uncharacterized protein YbjT (DUF2867 family)|nr:SDR family oxidoreductase [Vicinamibacterales bacterium]
MSDKILVLGATGHVGTPLVSQLVAGGLVVKAASRHATPTTGAEAVRFDYADASTFDAALAGVSRVFVVAPGGTVDPRPVLTPFLTRAIERRVGIVLQTVFGVDADESIPYRQVELALERSGAPFVILRPNWFADNFHTAWLAGIQHGVIAVPAGDGKSSFIDVRDVASSAAAALASDRFDGKAFNLTGPAALSYGDAAAILSRVSGRAIRYTPIDDEAFVSMLTGAGVPADYARFLASIFAPVREGWTAAVTDAVRTLTGRTPRSLEQYAKDHAAAFGA